MSTDDQPALCTQASCAIHGSANVYAALAHQHRSRCLQPQSCLILDLPLHPTRKMQDPANGMKRQKNFNIGVRGELGRNPLRMSNAATFFYSMTSRHTRFNSRMSHLLLRQTRSSCTENAGFEVAIRSPRKLRPSVCISFLQVVFVYPGLC